MRNTGPALLAAALCAAAPAWAAGGHHAVDDAALLEPGQCELEGWLARAHGGERLAHAGAGCRIGPAEVGLAGEHARLDGASATGWGMEAKWAMEWREGFSVGAKVGPSWAAHARPRYQGTSVSGLATWQPHEGIALHLNLGRDLVHRGDDLSRYGASVEWSAAPAWSLVAERYKEEGSHFVRAGVRFLAAESWSIDLSRSHRLGAAGASAWTVGATRALGRR